MPISKNSDAYRVQKVLMTVTSLWPKRDSSLLYKIWGTFNYFLVLSFALSLLVSTLVVSGFAKLIQSWSMFVTIINCSIKFTIFFFKYDVFLDVLDFLKSPHFSYYDEVFDVHLKKQIKFATAMARLFTFSGFTTVTLIVFAPVISPQEYRQTPLPFPVNLPDQPFIVFFCAYLFQSCALYSAGFSDIGFDSLSTGMMGVSSGYFKILHDSILQIISKNTKDIKEMSKWYKDKEKNIYEQLTECVEHHIALIKLTETIEDIFSYVFLSQFVCSAVGMCLVGFTFINTAPGSPDFIFALSFLSSLMLQITLYCSFGNEVTLQSSQIRDACYFTEWVYCGHLVRTPLFLIMERSKRPLVLTAGKFVDLSLASLAAVFKSAASYAAVLRQMQNK